MTPETPRFQRPTMGRYAPLSSQEVVDRSAETRPSFRYAMIVMALFFLVAALMVGVPPVHAWVIAHREFWLGVLIGSLLELAAVYLSRWAWDRWLWLRWFSHQ
jgi:hypothetical protein